MYHTHQKENKELLMKAVFLYDVTAIMAMPWIEAGYDCFCFDGQHEDGVAQDTKHPNLYKVGKWFDPYNIEADLEEIVQIVGSKIDFVFGFPECTHLAVSGAKHFARKKAENPKFQWEALQLAFLVKLLGEKYGVPWAFENPISVISSMYRKPCFSFHPYEYGGYLDYEPEHPMYPDYIPAMDAYTKKTCIWSGNDFVVPVKKQVEPLSRDNPGWRKLGGRSKRTKNIRSATPRGFAKAVFEANKGI